MTGPADVLAGLRGYHLPEPIPWWPPAPGWWLLVALALGAAALLLVLRRRRQRQRTPAALAARELAALDAAYRRDGDARAYASGLSQLLRRLVLVQFPGAPAAGLCGEAWLGFLAEHGRGEAFRTGIGRRLADAPYRPDPALDVDALGRAAADWIGQLERRDRRGAVRGAR